MPEPGSKTELYLQLLCKWQKAVNLVSNSSLAEAQERHFDDSLQLAAYIPQGARVFDLGSGAGFPGLVLAMIRPDLDMSLIESDHKKCTFLSTVSRETKTPVTIINERVEAVKTDLVPDIITARALAPLDKLLDYCADWAEQNPALLMLFLKGEKAQKEIEGAQHCYDFKGESFPSKTAPEGCILRVTNLFIKPLS